MWSLQAGRRRLVLAGVLFLAAALPYSSALRNGFVKEDHQSIELGRAIGSLANVPALFAHDAMWSSQGDRYGASPLDTYRPITMTTFFVEAAIFGRTPAPFHADSILVHAGCVLLLFAVGRALGVSERGALAGAIVFAVHPAVSGAVHWINGRSDPLCLLFFLAALLLSVRGTPRVRRDFAVASLFFAATLCKETAFCLAVGALPILLAPRLQVVRFSAALRSLLPWVLGGALGLGTRLWALERLAASRDTRQMAHALRRLPAIWLDGLGSFGRAHGDMLASLFERYRVVPSWKLVLGSVLAGLALAVATRQWRRGRTLVAWATTTYLAAMAPIALLTVEEGWSGWGRYLYTAGAPLLLVTGAFVLDDVLPRLTSPALRRVLVASSVACAALLASQTWTAGRDWFDDRSVALAEIADHPEISVGYAALAVVEERSGRHARALALLDRAIALAPKDNFNYWSARARSLILLGRRTEAFAAARHALELQPADRNARYIHALGLLEEGHAAESARLLVALATEDPTYRAPRATLREGARRFGPNSAFARALRALETGRH